MAILSALYLKKKQFVFIPEENFNEFNSIKTKKLSGLIAGLNLNVNSKILFILSKPNKFLWLSSRNLKNVDITTSSCLNIEQLLNANHIILSNTGLELINTTYGKN